jgi:hypothetical protein
VGLERRGSTPVTESSLQGGNSTLQRLERPENAFERLSLRTRAQTALELLLVAAETVVLPDRRPKLLVRAVKRAAAGSVTLECGGALPVARDVVRRRTVEAGRPGRPVMITLPAVLGDRYGRSGQERGRGPDVLHAILPNYNCR